MPNTEPELNVACPRCEAPPGEPCRASEGPLHLGTFHAARYGAAERVAVSDSDPLSVTCPRCKAPAGLACTTPSGGYSLKEHMARVDAANKPIRTKTGRILSDADIEALADEAERGYDVSHLKAKTKLPPKLKYRVRARSQVWCDVHGGTHEATRDLFDEGDIDCVPANWRRVYIESDDKGETF